MDRPKRAAAQKKKKMRCAHVLLAPLYCPRPNHFNIFPYHDEHYIDISPMFEALLVVQFVARGSVQGATRPSTPRPLLFLP